MSIFFFASISPFSNATVHTTSASLIKKQLHAESGPRNAAKSVIKNSRYLQAFLTPCLGSKLD